MIFSKKYLRLLPSYRMLIISEVTKTKTPKISIIAIRYPPQHLFQYPAFVRDIDYSNSLCYNI